MPTIVGIRFVSRFEDDICAGDLVAAPPFWSVIQAGEGLPVRGRSALL
ncbi:hypothetical protein [Bradyrhizobium tunisiense]